MPNPDYQLNNGTPTAHHFKPGNPGGPGRPRKELASDDSPLGIAKRRGYVPYELLIDACQAMSELIHDPSLTKSERIKLIGIYTDTVLRSTEYLTPKLRAVEHSGQIDILQRLQNVSQCTDEELVKLLADADEYIAKHSG